MKKKKKLFLLLMLAVIPLFITGCRQDDMEDIDVVVTNYPNEYITSKLYGKHANIESIYPDGVDIASYKITSKKKDDYAKSGLFIYNGLIKKERNLALDLLDRNGDLKIIDTAYSLDENESEEELWLNPSELLMMAKNVQLGLNEYVTSTYLKKEIDKNFESLKVTLSELDADYREAVQDTENKEIVVNSSNLKFLEKFGLTVYVVDDEASDKTISDVEELMKNGKISYIYDFKDDSLSNNSKKLLATYTNVKENSLHKIDNLSDTERENNKDYVSLMKDNLTLLKEEMYQ